MRGQGRQVHDDDWSSRKFFCVEIEEYSMTESNVQPDTNPVWYLARMLWRYSDGNRIRVVVYVVLFVIANGIYFFEPLVIAKLLNTVQEFGVTAQTLPSLLGDLGLLLAITLGFWVFHGPARVIEMANAFLVRAHYKQYLIEGLITDRPLDSPSLQTDM